MKCTFSHANDCDLASQQDKENKQETPQYWKNCIPGTYFVAFTNQSYCNLIETFTSGKTKQASQATLSEYKIVPVHCVDDIGLGSNTNPFPRDELLKVLDTKYVSLHRVEAFCKTMKKDIGEILVSPNQLAQCIVNCQEYLLTKIDYQSSYLTIQKSSAKNYSTIYGYLRTSNQN